MFGTQATLIARLHVRDIAHPDNRAQRDDVHGVLRDLGLGDVVDEGRIIEAHNKIDLLSSEHRSRLQNIAERETNGVPLSATSGQGCDDLLARIDGRLSESRQILDLSVRHSDGATIAWLYSHGEILERVDDDEVCHLKVGLNAADAARYAHRDSGSNL